MDLVLAPDARGRSAPTARRSGTRALWSRAAALVAALAILALPPCAATAAATSGTLTGHITSITDGDTLDLTTPDRQTIRIRLAEIDAPERRQPFGTVAKQALSDLAFGKEATVDVTDHDRYGRAVGLVRVGDIDVNAEMVRRGMAWVFLKYRHRPMLVEIEAEARKAKRGLWVDPRAVAPWEWRGATMARVQSVPRTDQCDGRFTNQCRQTSERSEGKGIFTSPVASKEGIDVVRQRGARVSA